MGDLTVKKRRYKELLRSLFPRGWAWEFEEDSLLGKLIAALAVEPARIDERGNDFLREIDPSKTFEMIDNWERMLGIPDECTPTTYDPGLNERRQRIIQKLTMTGGQSIAFYKFIASQLGYDIDIQDVANYQKFRAGFSRAGDPLTNGADWAYAFAVIAPPDFVRYFKAGRSTAGERLVLVSNETLECLIRKFAPAHTSPIFIYLE